MMNPSEWDRAQRRLLELRVIYSVGKLAYLLGESKASVWRWADRQKTPYVRCQARVVRGIRAIDVDLKRPSEGDQVNAP